MAYEKIGQDAGDALSFVAVQLHQPSINAVAFKSQDIEILVDWHRSCHASTVRVHGNSASIKLPQLPLGSAGIDFDDNYGLHLISVSAPTSLSVGWWPSTGLGVKLTRNFVYNSAPYVWEITSGLAKREYTLYRRIGISGGKEWRNEVARFTQPRRESLQGPLILIVIIASSYIVECFIYLASFSIETGWWAPKHSIVHVLGSSLIWACAGLSLLSPKALSWHHHRLFWTFSLLLQVAHIVLGIKSFHGNDRYRWVSLAFQGCRLCCTTTLSATGHRSVLWTRVEELATEERQPLLGNDGSTSQSERTRLPEQSRNPLMKKGFKSVSILLPHLWPRHDWGMQLNIIIMIAYVFFIRWMHVMEARQLGIVTEPKDRIFQLFDQWLCRI